MTCRARQGRSAVGGTAALANAAVIEIATQKSAWIRSMYVLQQKSRAAIATARLEISLAELRLSRDDDG